MPEEGGKTTTDQLRDDIDRSRTGEKVRLPDSAAVPLGTGGEVAGRPPNAGTLAEARPDERARGNRIRSEQAGVLARTCAILLAAVAVIVFLFWAVLR